MHFLLHTCCAPCAVYVIQELKKRGFDISVFFYNPNIYPEEEYVKRRDEIKKYCEQNKIEFIEGEYNVDRWRELVKGLENEPEGGRRCEVCYKMRLDKTAEHAKENGFDYLGATLSISPHKKSAVINKIGKVAADKHDLKFYEEDWKKQNGFKCACELSQEQGFYRQKYCGCAYSLGHQSTGTLEHKTKNVYSVPVPK